MPLPSLEKIQPQFELTIPSTEQTLMFRPFLVKEEKILLLAMESKDEKTMLDAMVQVIKSCALAPIKVEDLASFDLEYLFLQLRAKSVHEIAELAYKCVNEIELSSDEIEKRGKRKKIGSNNLLDLSSNNNNNNNTEGSSSGPVFGKCENVVQMKIDLTSVKVQNHPEHTKKIMLTPTLGVSMKYPNFQMAKANLSKNNKTSGITDTLLTVALCIESVFDEESVYTNFQPKEIQEWIEKLTQTQFSLLQQFFETMPKLEHDVLFVCNACGYQETIHLEGLASFFG